MSKTLNRSEFINRSFERLSRERRSRLCGEQLSRLQLNLAYEVANDRMCEINAGSGRSKEARSVVKEVLHISDRRKELLWYSRWTKDFDFVKKPDNGLLFKPVAGK